MKSMYDWEVTYLEFNYEKAIVIIRDCEFSEIYIYADSDYGISEDDIIKVERI